MIKNKLYALYILMVIFLPININAQVLIRYNKDFPGSAVHYNQFLEGIFQEKFDKRPKFPAIGDYSPSKYSLQGVKVGTGVCNYIYIPTNNQLEPGHQYHISLTIKIAEAYKYQFYYQDNFGIALTSNLFDNHFGLWSKHFIPIGLQAIEELVTIEFEFRPLCSSNYILLGVFQGDNMDEKSCFACPYEFELHSLEIKKSIDPNTEFYYICDGFIEDKLNKKWDTSYSTDTIYFDSGSAELKDEFKQKIDSIPNKLRTKQDLVSLYAFTDQKGSDNEQLGADRNAAVRDALIDRGVNPTRILVTNYGESKSTHFDSRNDRKVEIDVNLGKLHQKIFCEALQAVEDDDFGTAQKKMMNVWLHMVPPNKAIYALFDCWGNSEKSIRFKKSLKKVIKSKFYNGKKLKFTLDSLYCENLDVNELGGYLAMLHLPTYKNNCNNGDKTDYLKEERHTRFVDQFYAKHGFPSKEEVGVLGNKTLPSIILSSDNMSFLQKYLPLVKTACERKTLSWNFYARLFDKVGVFLNGYQRYGTLMYINNEGLFSPLYPIEDITMLSEYRKQVKLAPYTNETISKIKKDQRKLDKSLIKRLNIIHQSDQQFRNQTRSLEQKYGLKSKELKANWKSMIESDSLNLIQIKEILDNRGWIGPNIIGKHGNETLFLVIQHSNLDTQLKYLPIFREAVRKGDGELSDLAMLEDRVAVSEGKKQVYGTQIGRDTLTGERFVAPLIDPENVNNRRAKMNLEKIEDYIKHWGMDWKLEKQKIILNKNKN